LLGEIARERARRMLVAALETEVAAHLNDRRINADGERRRFTSRILPPSMRRSPKVAEVLPVLYLRGLSTGDFCGALAARNGIGSTSSAISSTSCRGGSSREGRPPCTR